LFDDKKPGPFVRHLPRAKCALRWLINFLGYRIYPDLLVDAGSPAFQKSAVGARQAYSVLL